MRGVEGTALESSHGHSRAGANEGRKTFAICGDEISSFTAFSEARWVGEVVDELLIVGEEGDTISSCIGKEELLS